MEFARRGRNVNGDREYEVEFAIPEDFGDVGAILIENQHRKPMYVKNIVIDGFAHGKIVITCDSWVHSKFDNPQKRIFFTNKSYLPSQTPSGIKRLREEELVTLRGDGVGERKKFERIYDYDVYSDIGDPNGNDDGKRPILGGKKLPYPRRCRTGRPRSEKGYFPNRPTIARLKMPTEDPTKEEWESFLNKPEDALLKCFPSQIQATVVMAVLDVLSNHSPDEEYVGKNIEPFWAEDPVINPAFEVFSGRLKELEGIIDDRNADCNLRNRNGAGVVP